MSCRRLRCLALAIAGAKFLACGTAHPEDALVLRCLEALEVREPELSGIRVLDEARPDEQTRQILFSARIGEDGLHVEDLIQCGFQGGDRWTLQSIQMGGRTLREGEVALVNSNLLLRDLSEHPERLNQSEVAAEPAEAKSPAGPKPQAQP